jgi:hypothetical protein
MMRRRKETEAHFIFSELTKTKCAAVRQKPENGEGQLTGIDEREQNGTTAHSRRVKRMKMNGSEGKIKQEQKGKEQRRRRSKTKAER